MLLATKVPTEQKTVFIYEQSTFLVKEENIQKFLEQGGTWTLKSITEWEPKETKTKKERENEPKEAVPLSRWSEADSKDSF